MQLETLSSIEQVKNFYKKEMPKRNWNEKKINVFQGADAALNFKTEKHTARILIINDKIQDFRKIAVTLNKRVNPEDALNK